MLIADVQFYDVVKWLHIAAIVVGFGPPFAFGLYMAFIGRNHPRSIPAVLQAQALVLRTMTTIGAVVILVTGVYLTSERFDFGYFFVAWGIVAIVVMMGLIHGVFLPTDRKAGEVAQRDIEAAPASGGVEFGEAFWNLANRSRRLGPVAGIIVILTIYVMTTKPFSF